MFPHLCCESRLSLSMPLRLAALALLIGHAALPAASPRTVACIHDIYDVPASEASLVYGYSWDLDILYSDPDPEWNLLWVENNGFATFVPMPRGFAGFPAGSRVRAEGELIPAKGLALDNARFAVLPGPSRVVPVQATGQLADADRLVNRLVTLEAVVDRQSEPDASHLMLEASAEGLPVIVRVRVAPGGPRPNLEGMVIRATGVYVGQRNFSGALTSVALWVRGLEAIEPLAPLAEDTSFASPVVRIDRIAATDASRPVHIVGTVNAFDNTAATVTLRDATGQIVVSTAQRRGIGVGATLEAIGFPEVAGVNRFLRGARVRLLPALPLDAPLPGPGETGEPLRLADQVLALKPADADRALPAQLFGVATWMDPDRTSMFVQDTTGGVEIRQAAGAPYSPVLPCTVRIEGRTARGAFAPLVVADSVVWGNPLGSPEPRLVTLEEMLTGNAHGRWVAVQALLRGIRREQGSTQLDLTTATGELVAWLPPESAVEALPGSIVSIRGVCSAIANERRQLTGVRLLVPDARQVAVDQAAPADPFALPARSIAALREFGPSDSTLRRVCILGTVLHHESGRYICLQDGNESLLALGRDTAPLFPGDRVEVVGLPGREGIRLVLREALYRRVGHGAEPDPIELLRPESPGEGFDGRLVRMTGVVNSIQPAPAETIITVQSGKRLFRARIAREGFEAGRCPVDGVVALRGVYRAIYDEYRRPIDFTLRLRTADDITLLEAPPLWTVPRALAVAAGLLLLTAAVLGWLAVLRSRVAKQTEQIRAQLEREQQLETELQRAQRLESLALMAGGIAHDFNNMLTGVLANISFARLDARAVEVVGDSLADAELATLRARDLSMRLLLFAKGGTPSRTVVDLAGLVRDAAKFALHGASVRGEFSIPSDLWPADVDSVQIGQVVQNLAINAVQAMPAGGTLRLVLANEVVDAGVKAGLQPGRYIRLEATDTGRGIPPEVLPKIFDPYFTTKKDGNGLGLATVFSIVRRHGGHIEVESAAGRGTTFRLWLPAADPSRTAPAPAGGAAPETVSLDPELVRILVMDDDATIRRAATSALMRVGYEVATAADGAEAVEAFDLARRHKRPFRLVVLDLTVPGGLGGKEALDAIRRLDPEVRAVVSSGNASTPCFASCREHGFDAALAKPYEVKELIALVGQSLAGRRA